MRKQPNLQFRDIVACLEPLTGSHRKAQNQVRDVIDMIVIDPDEIADGTDHPTEAITEETARKIGTSDKGFPKRAARVVYHNLDLAKFMRRISDAPIPQQQAVLDRLKERGRSGIKLPELPGFMADQTQRALMKIAGISQSADQTRRRQLAQAEAIALHTPAVIAQSRACALCGRSLYEAKNGKSAVDYKVVPIDLNAEALDFDDLVALCHACRTRHVGAGLDTGELEHLRETKCSLTAMDSDFGSCHIRANAQKIREAIMGLSKLCSGKMADDTKLNRSYNPATIAEKVPDDVLLRNRILMEVTEYYPAVEQTLKNLELENEIEYIELTKGVRITFLKLNQKGLSAREIIDKMTSWLKMEVGTDMLEANIVISYFVQICEVLNAPSE